MQNIKRTVYTSHAKWRNGLVIGVSSNLDMTLLVLHNCELLGLELEGDSFLTSIQVDN